MTREEMTNKLIGAFNKAHNTRFRYSESNREIANLAIEVAGEEAFWSREISRFICDYNTDDLNEAFDAFIRTKKHETIPEEVPTIETPQPEAPQTQVNNYMGLLEQTLAEVIIKTQGESIANGIVNSIGSKVDEYVRNTYGTIHRKVEVELGETKVEFKEILHEKFETVLKFVKMDEPVFLTGQAGTGKNVLCKQVAKALGLDFYFTNAVTQEYKLTGFTDAMGVFHETEFYKAFKNGGIFMLDEMDASIPEVLVILNSAIANRYFDFPAPIGYVEAHPDFRVIGAGNTFGLGADYEYVGRNQLDGASLDRFAMVRIDYDRNIELSITENDSDLVDFCEEFRNASNRAGVRTIVSYRGIGRIHRMAQLMDLDEVLTTCLLKNLQKDDVNMVIREMHISNKYLDALKALADKM